MTPREHAVRLDDIIEVAAIKGAIELQLKEVKVACLIEIGE